MDKRLIHNFTWIPVLLIAIIAISMGVVWMLHPEPWLLDKVPNEILLKSSFEKLFANEINLYLSSYLIVIYKFFGLWLMSIGLLILNYVYITRLGTKSSRTGIHIIILIILTGMYVLVFKFIPTSPFVVLLYLLTALFVTSICFSFKLGE
tara:strand:- start:323 stop:772 length:450 start_codon:yes stop_codon:yes gene_type:complete